MNQLVKAILLLGFALSLSACKDGTYTVTIGSGSASAKATSRTTSASTGTTAASGAPKMTE